MITVQVQGAWLLVSGADAGEMWVALHRVLSVVTTQEDGLWCVVIAQAGADEEQPVYVDDEDAACALAAEVRDAVDAAHRPAPSILRPADLMRLLAGEDLDVLMAGGKGLAHMIAEWV